MKIATICVSGVEAAALDRKSITMGLAGATVEFEYTDPMWSGLTKNVVFDGATTVAVYNAGTVVEVPSAVLAVKNTPVRVGVCGIGGDGSEVVPTIWADLGVVRSSAFGQFPPPAEVPLPVWAQVMALIGDLNKLTTEAKENLVAAINEAAASGGGGGVDANTLQEAINAALAQAKASGEFDGEDGTPGKDGATYIPSVQNGYLSWRNEQGRPNPASSYIKGEPGKDGAPGKDGQDGYTPQKGIDYFDGKDGQPGKDGVDGKDGQPGADGKSAYQYAVDGGYTGTEQEFTDKLAVGNTTLSITDDGNGNVTIAATGGIPGNAKLYYVGNAGSEFSANFESNAVGALQEE